MIRAISCAAAWRAWDLGAVVVVQGADIGPAGYKHIVREPRALECSTACRIANWTVLTTVLEWSHSAACCPLQCLGAGSKAPSSGVWREPTIFGKCRLNQPSISMQSGSQVKAVPSEASGNKRRAAEECADGRHAAEAAELAELAPLYAAVRKMLADAVIPEPQASPDRTCTDQPAHDYAAARVTVSNRGSVISSCLQVCSPVCTHSSSDLEFTPVNCSCSAPAPADAEHASGACAGGGS